MEAPGPVAGLGRPVPWAGSILWVLDGAMLFPGLVLLFLAPVLLFGALLLALFLLLRGQGAAVMPALPVGVGIGAMFVGSFVITNSPSSERVALVLAGVALAVAASALPARRRIRRPTAPAPSRWSS